MKAHGVSTFALVSSLALAAACQKEDPRITELLARVDKIDQRMEALEKRPAGAPARPQPRRPDPKLTYHVPVDDTDVVSGAKHAKVTIIEGFDYACPWCALARPVVKDVLAKYPEDVRVVSKQFVIHPDTANLPALGVCAARNQGKAAAYEDAVWANAWKQENGRPRMDVTQLKMDALEKLVAGLGLDVARWKADAEGPACKEWVTRHYKELAAVGVSGTPSFFVNGRPYTGARTVEGFSAVVDEELKKADGAIAGGVKVEDYYAQLMKTAQKSL
jgi:protein-disulfide isomerase